MLAGIILMVAFAPALTTAGMDDGPYIVHVSDTPPDYTLVISGGGYDPQSVRVIVHVPGTLTAQREALPQLVAGLADRYSGRAITPMAKPPAAQTHTVQPVHASDRTVFAKLPSQPYPPGYLAIVWLKDGNRLSNPFVVNQPRAWFLLKPVCRPGELNRLCGANLIGDKYVRRYVFLRPKGGRPVSLEEVPRHHEDGVSENFCVQFRVPPDQPAGDYDVFVHNNSGSDYGFTPAMPLAIIARPSFPQKLYVATEHGIKGDSFTDCRAALQALIDRAGEAGGGIVFLPPGAYRADDTIQMRQHVILRGAGRDATTLFFGGAPHEKKRTYWFLSAREANHTGIEDLTVRLSPPMTMAISYYNKGLPTYDTHMLRLRLVGGSVSIQYNVNMEIGECCFEPGSLHIHNLRQGWIHDNELTLGRLGGSPFGLWASENCTIEHNRVYGSNRGFVWQIHGNFGHYHNLIDANVVETARFGGNSGETYLFEGAGFQWLGRPDEVRSAGFAVRGAGWKPDVLKDSFAVVAGGRGLGQYVRIAGNTDAEVALAQPWPLPPSGDVRIAVLRGVVENAITNNRHADSDNSMMFYGAGILNNRISRNRSENTLGISIWSWAEETKNQLIPDYFNIFEGNVLEDQGSFWLTRLGDLRQPIGVRNLNNVFRDNFVADARRKRENQYNNVWEHGAKHGGYRPVQSAFWLDVGRSHDADRQQGPIWIDALIEHNYVTRCDWGIELRKIAAGALVQANTFFDVKLPIIDQGKDNVSIANRVEQPVFKNPPPWAEVDRGGPARPRSVPSPASPSP